MDYFLNNLEEKDIKSDNSNDTNLDHQANSIEESPSEDTLDILLVEYVIEQF